jgi:8-oxo-dGTP diphosphatase
MARAQCLIVRNNRILMTKHRIAEREWWCLPGGGIDKNETPEAAAVRELKEECNVIGKIIRMISHNSYSDENKDYTFLIDIDGQEPQLGFDPELVDSRQIMTDLKWLSLNEIPERDRCFLWASGLIGVSSMINEIEKWGDKISYPGEE